MNRLEHQEYEVYTSENYHNTTADDIAAVFDDEALPTDKEYKKDFHYLEKLSNNHKADDILDAHTNGKRRFELFMDKKTNSYITGILEFIDEKLNTTIKSMYALQEMPKDRIDDYIKKYEELSAQEMRYENMRTEIIKYYTVKK